MTTKPVQPQNKNRKLLVSSNCSVDARTFTGALLADSKVQQKTSNRSFCSLWMVGLVSLLLCHCTGGWPSVRENLTSKVALKTNWSTSIGSKNVYVGDYLAQTFATVSVFEKAAYVGSLDGNFYSLSVADGKILWKQKLTGAVFAAPLVLSKDLGLQTALVVVGNEAGDVTAMDADTGKIVWTYHYKSPIQSLPAYGNDLIYLLSSDGVLHALRAKDGEWVWGHERNALGEVNIRRSRSVLVHDGVVYAGFLDGFLVSFSGKTGEILWNRKLVDDESEIHDVFTPVIKKDTLFVSSFEGGVYALQVKDGSTRWHYDLKKKYNLNAGPLSVSEDADSIYVSIASGGIHALDGMGHVQWRQILKNGGETTTPVIFGPYLLFGASEKGLYLVDRKLGSLVKYFGISNAHGSFGRRLSPWNGITEAPTLSGSKVYFITNQERVYSLDIVTK